MKSSLPAALLLLLVIPPAYGQLSDATGLVYSFDVETGGHAFEIRTVSNFDVVDHEYVRGEKRLTLFVESGLENNLGEIIIPQALLGGNFSFYLNGEPFTPKLRTTETISFVTLDFEGTGQNRIDITATKAFAGPEDASPPGHETGEGGGCLVATAAYGTELAPQVQQLREIRDQKLMQTGYGRSLLESFHGFYYSFSPYVADLQRENPAFRDAVRIGITPMIISLSVLGHADMDSEEQVLGYGAALVLLNVGMYLAAPAAAAIWIGRIPVRKRVQSRASRDAGRPKGRCKASAREHSGAGKSGSRPRVTF